jgi:uncharacterized protein (TIGR02145 family)
MNILMKALETGLVIITCLFLSCKEERIPAVSTWEIAILTDTSAYGGGEVTDQGSGPVISRGLCWSIEPIPSITDYISTSLAGAGTFSNYLTGLETNTFYYVSAFATNEVGTAYGDVLSLVLWMNAPGPDITDIESNTYGSVKIGAQIWMAENLKATKYNDGTPITLVTDETEWENRITEAYCWYNNDETIYRDIYGALYNWYSVNTGKLCPTGWHVPTDEEWTTLTDYLESTTYAGGKLKEAGASHWGVQNTAATNESGFTALPGGDRGPNGVFYGIEASGYWWTSSSYPFNNNTDAYYRRILTSDDDVETLFFHKTMGESIRCIKD